MLNRGGKRIDTQHAQKQTVVGAHMLHQNAHDPANLEKTKAGNLLVSRYHTSANTQASNVQIAH